MAQEFPGEVDEALAERLTPQSDFPPLGYVGDPASFRQEDALTDYLKKAPEYDARRIVAFFSPKKAAPRPMVAPADRDDLDVKARGVLDRYIKAMGGADRLKAIQSQLRTGQLLEESRTVPLEAMWSAQGKWALNLQQAPGITERFGFTGSFGWHAERGEVGQLPEPLVTVISLALDPQLPLHLTGLFARLTTAAEQLSQARREDVLEGETTSGMKARLVFDSTTGFLVRFNETIFGDHREVDGVMLPFAVTIRPGTRVQFDRMENNASLASVDFDPPK
jgi:hypothetical protein